LDAKSQRILTKLPAVDDEYIPERIQNFVRKYFFNIGAINFQILMTKYLSFHCANYGAVTVSGSSVC